MGEKMSESKYVFIQFELLRVIMNITKITGPENFVEKNPTKTLHEVYIFSSTIFTNITNMKVVLSVSM